MMNFQKMSSRYFKDIYMTEIRSTQISDSPSSFSHNDIIGQIEDNVYYNLQSNRNSSMLSSQPIIIVVNRVESYIPSYNTNRICDNSCKFNNKIKEKPLTTDDVTKKIPTENENLLLLM